MEWITTEQEFMHKRAMLEAQDLDREKLLEILEKVHKQYFIYYNLFSKLVIWCCRNNLTLPSFEELLAQTKPTETRTQ